MTTITTVKQANARLNGAIKDKNSYKEAIQDCIEFFVNEYNGKLSANATYLKQIFQVVGKDAVDLKLFIKNYTNMTTIGNDLLHFTTDTFDVGAKGQKKYILKFNDSFNGQKWYESSAKTDEKALKEITDGALYIKIRNLIALIKSDKNKSTAKNDDFLRVAEAYGKRLKAVADSKK